MKDLKDLVDSVKNHTPSGRPSKANRTVYVLEPQFSNFIRYCQSKGIKHSEVLDKLIAMFLHEVRDDLPPDITYDPRTADGKKSA